MFRAAHDGLSVPSCLYLLPFSFKVAQCIVGLVCRSFSVGRLSTTIRARNRGSLFKSLTLSGLVFHGMFIHYKRMTTSGVNLIC
jgi:hypothetical protein